MTEALSLDRRRTLHRRALWLEYFTISWNVIEAVVAIGAGIIAGSVALIGFGVDSAVEAISALGLLWRLRKAGPDATVAEEGGSERRALYIVAPPSSCWLPTSPSRPAPPCSTRRNPTAPPWAWS
jgi:hypothetical protein